MSSLVAMGNLLTSIHYFVFLFQFQLCKASPQPAILVVITPILPYFMHTLKPTMKIDAISKCYSTHFAYPSTSSRQVNSKKGQRSQKLHTVLCSDNASFCVQVSSSIFTNLYISVSLIPAALSTMLS